MARFHQLFLEANLTSRIIEVRIDNALLLNFILPLLLRISLGADTWISGDSSHHHGWILLLLGTQLIFNARFEVDGQVLDPVGLKGAQAHL